MAVLILTLQGSTVCFHVGGCVLLSGCVEGSHGAQATVESCRAESQTEGEAGQCLGTEGTQHQEQAAYHPGAAEAVQVPHQFGRPAPNTRYCPTNTL